MCPGNSFQYNPVVWTNPHCQICPAGDDPEIERGKPAPDIFLRAAELIDASPAATLVFEDAPTGLAAAMAAGMRTMGGSLFSPRTAHGWNSKRRRWERRGG